MHLDDKVTLKFLWDQGFTVTLDPGTAERMTLTKSKCPLCGSLTLTDGCGEQHCTHCEWGN